MSRDALEADLGLLRAAGLTIDVEEDDKRYHVIVRQYPLPPGTFNKGTSDILIHAPKPYPRGKMDMFWTDEDLLLAEGRPPNAAEHIATHLGRRWRRFSRHTHRGWRPGFDNVRTHWSLVVQSLLEASA